MEAPDDAELSREVPAPRRAGRAAAEWVNVRGVVVVAAGAVESVLATLLPLPAELVEAVRPMMGGVEIRGVPGLEDFGVDGLDQELKKSSSVSSFAGVAAGGSMPSTTMPFGNLKDIEFRKLFQESREAPCNIVLDTARELFPIQLSDPA